MGVTFPDFGIFPPCPPICPTLRGCIGQPQQSPAVITRRPDIYPGRRYAFQRKETAVHPCPPGVSGQISFAHPLNAVLKEPSK